MFDDPRNRRLHALGGMALAYAVIAMTPGCGGDSAGAAPPTDGGTGDTSTGSDASTDTGSGADSGSTDSTIGDDATDASGGDATDAADSADSGPLGTGMIGTLTKVSADPGSMSPFDATPSPDGTSVYFTAIGSAGPGLFKVAATGGTPVQLDTGNLLIAPFGVAVSADGATLYVADPGYDDPTASHPPRGRIYSLPAGGGAPTAVGNADNYVARSVELSGANLYFTGVDPANGKAGVFSVPTGGGAVSTIAEGAPFVDPSGITVSADGKSIYVADTIASGSGHAQIVSLKGGTATVFVADLSVGYPAGVALVQDESAILVSGLGAPNGTDAIWRYPIGASGAGTASSFTTGLGSFNEPAGLHRAKGGDSYAWVDGTANVNGTVFVLSK
jgi:hypothetical protein